MCDTWIALGDATASQQTLFGKNSDRPAFDCQPLMFYPAQSWPDDSRIQLEYLTLPQVDRTFATLGSSPYWCWGYEEGVNEHGVVIGNEAIYTKTFKQTISAYQSGQGVSLGLLGMDLIRLVLERSQTASQAVKVMGELITQYGQFGSGVPMKAHAEGGYDNSFIIADATEAWVLEAVGTRWVARRFGEGCVSISNQPTIRQRWDAGSADIEIYARQQGWWTQSVAFDFSRAYIDDDTSRQVSHIRVMRSGQLLAERKGTITPQWMMRIARDHYEDTFVNGPYFDPADPDFLSICMHVSQADFTWGNTASSCVAQLPKSPGELPVFWWTPGPPCNGCYLPFFVHGSRLPEIVSTAGRAGKQVVPPPRAVEDQFSAQSYWWLFRQLMDRVKGDPIKSVPGYYPARNALVRERFDALERDFEAQLPATMTRAVHQKTGEVDAGILDAFTADCVNRVLGAITALLQIFD